MANRQGKLIKKTDEKMMDMLDMESYPWLHFNEQSIIFPDNVKRTVILEKMHDPQELSQKIIAAKEFEKPFGMKSKPLLPRDMTEDYKRGQREAIKRRRRTLMDEEEAMALELAELEHIEEIKLGKINLKDKNNSNTPEKKFDPHQKETAAAENTGANSIDTEGKKNQPINESEEKKENLEHNQPIKPQIDPKALEIEMQKSKEEAYQVGYKEGFESGEGQGKEEGYKVGIENGSKVGFQNGEERGLIAAETKYDKAFANISEAAVKMNSLKTTLLEEGKDIFIEILKLCSEKILREQIKSNDSTLFKIFDEVIKMFNANSSLSIQMNPGDAQRLKKHLESQSENHKVKIKENAQLDIGNFQVENDSGASLVDIKKNVDAIIENLKTDLFKEINTEEDKSPNYEHKKAG